MTDEGSDSPKDADDEGGWLGSLSDLKNDKIRGHGDAVDRNDAGEPPQSQEVSSRKPDSYLSDLMSEIDADEEESVWDDLDRDREPDQGRVLSDSKSSALIEMLGNAQNVLLLGPLLCPADYDVGTALMGIRNPANINLLTVTYSQSPDDRLSIFRSYLNELPARTTIIGMGMQSRSSGTSTIDTGSGTVTIESVADPSDLKRLGITIGKTLREWEDTGRQSVLCFHSLTSLLQFVDDTRRIFRFLNILRGRIQNADARAHYHMERAAHDEQLIRTLGPVFDAVVTYDEDGSLSIDT